MRKVAARIARYSHVIVLQFQMPNTVQWQLAYSHIFNVSFEYSRWQAVISEYHAHVLVISVFEYHHAEIHTFKEHSVPLP